MSNKTTSSITVEVDTTNAEGGTFTYYYKKEVDTEWIKAGESKENTYTFSGLEANVIYNIKVEVEKDGKTAEKETSTITGELPEGAVQFSPIEWNNGEASTIITTNETGYTIQYQIGGIEEGEWTDTTSGTAIGGLHHGDIVYGRLFDGTNGSKTANINVEDLEIPQEAEISLSGTSTNTAGNVTAEVKLKDNESGVNTVVSKWVYNTTSTEIGIDESLYTGNFSENPQTITLSSTSAGTYYLHVLTVDNAGNKKETISEAITVAQLVTGISVSPTTVSLEQGATKQLTVTVTPENAGNKAVTWSSSNSNIASVSSSGLVTAKAAGSATITVKATDESNKSATCTVTVESPTVGDTVKEGEYINYVGGGKTIKCVVLYDSTSPYGVQIIAMSSLENVEIGNGSGHYEDNSSYFNRSRTSYNNAISTLNSRAEKYLNTTYASSARCVGSVPNNPDSESGMYRNNDDYMQDYTGTLKDMDDNYTTDYNQMQSLGLSNINADYWLASRYLNDGFMRY